MMDTLPRPLVRRAEVARSQWRPWITAFLASLMLVGGGWIASVWPRPF